MMEKELMLEVNENTEQRLVRLLKERGIDDPEVKNSLENWTREQERQVEQSADYILAQIKLTLRRARLYFEAGYFEDSFENFSDAKIQAISEGRAELAEEIIKEMDKIIT